MTRKQRIETITRLCNQAGCSEKLKKIHFEQFVDRDVHPHPPESFIAWFNRHPDNVGADGSGARTFWNTSRYYEQFMEMKRLGLLNETPKSLSLI
jgi:hypothetical protein